MKKIVITGFVAAALFIVGCSDSGNGPEPQKDPVLTVNKSEIDLAGSSRFDRFNLMNNGGGQVEWRITEKPEWIDVSDDNGIGLTATDTTTIRITTHFEDLDYGLYNGEIVITSNAGTVKIAVRLEYKAPLLKVDPALINMDRHYRYSEMSVINDGGGELMWTIMYKPDWLEFDQDSGYVYNQPEVVPYRARINSLSYGDYSDKLIIESNGGTIEVNVYLTYEREVEVYPPDGAAGIDLGFTYLMVEKLYGKPTSSGYQRPEKTIFIHNVFYAGPGLDFRVKNNSPILFGNGEIGYIRMVDPYDGLTPEMIGLGSTAEDVVAAYGEPQQKNGSDWIYEGISFVMKNDKVTEMIIQEPDFYQD